MSLEKNSVLIICDKLIYTDLYIFLYYYREKDIKKLFTNVKRDHKFLRRYMSDIKDYIDIMEQVNVANKKKSLLN